MERERGRIQAIQEVSGGCQGQLPDTGTRWATGFTAKEERVGNLVINGRLGCSDHGIVGCSILRGKVAEYGP